MRMNKFKFSLLIFLIMICSQGYAQVAKIVELKGEVSVKSDRSRSWRRAKINTYLKRKDEIMTKERSMCSLAFDEGLKNILTIKENSHIRIDNLRPGEVFMPRGRVFSLIEDLVLIRSFKVRTPVAVAGVRGTGDYVEHNHKGTIVKCFEGHVYIQILDKDGYFSSERSLFEGLGLDIDPDGEVRDMFFLDNNDYREWNEFRNLLIESQIQEPEADISFMGAQIRSRRPRSLLDEPQPPESRVDEPEPREEPWDRDQDEESPQQEGAPGDYDRDDEPQPPPSRGSFDDPESREEPRPQEDRLHDYDESGDFYDPGQDRNMRDIEEDIDHHDFDDQGVDHSWEDNIIIGEPDTQRHDSGPNDMPRPDAEQRGEEFFDAPRDEEKDEPFPNDSDFGNQVFRDDEKSDRPIENFNRDVEPINPDKAFESDSDHMDIIDESR
jgi:FecR protein